MSSKNIKISEGSHARAFGPVSRLRVADQDSGTEDFVLESDTTLITKSVDVNGTYHAAAEGAYGYSRVTVNCSQEADSISGKGQDGKTYVVEKDESGNIVETNVPTEIRVTTPPDILIYGDRARLDFTGLVLTAYGSDGEVWTSDDYPEGIIPIDDRYVNFPVQFAHYDPDSDTVTHWMESEDVTGITQPVPVAHKINGYAKWRSGGGTLYECTCSADSAECALMLLSHDSLPAIVVASKTGGGSAYCRSVRTGYHDMEVSGFIQADSYEEINGRDVYFSAGQYGNRFGVYAAEGREDTVVIGPDYTLDIAVGNYRLLAYVALYGSVTQTTGGMQVPVQWARPRDHKILEAAFGIDVIQGPSGANN